jgi:hypothetical protein
LSHRRSGVVRRACHRQDGVLPLVLGLRHWLKG